MADPKKALQEWQQKYGAARDGATTSRVTGSAIGAKSALEQWQRKYTVPQTFKNQNTADSEKRLEELRKKYLPEKYGTKEESNLFIQKDQLASMEKEIKRRGEALTNMRENPLFGKDEDYDAIFSREKESYSELLQRYNKASANLEKSRDIWDASEKNLSDAEDDAIRDMSANGWLSVIMAGDDPNKVTKAVEKATENDAILSMAKKNMEEKTRQQKEYQQIQKEKEREKERDEYNKLMRSQDFNLYSQYEKSGADGTEEDLTYGYINKDPEATKKLQEMYEFTDSFLQQMSEDEKSIFNYLYRAKGKDEAYKYAEFLEPDLNKRQRMKEETYWEGYAEQHPYLASGYSILTSPLKGSGYIGQAIDYMTDGEIDENAAYNRYSYTVNAIRNKVSKTIEKSGKWGEVGSFLYQTGMSMGDFLFNTAITGGLNGGGKMSANMALAIMGTGAAADATISAKERGLTDTQAFALGTIAGAAEIFTERFSIEALLNGKWEESAIKYILKNSFTEGSEEVGSDLINLFADIFISKDKSEWRKSIQAYIDMGYSEPEATGLAVKDQALSMGLDFLGGALSGGTMATAGVGIGTVKRNAGYKQTGRTLRKMGDEMVNSIIETAETLDENSEAYKLGQELKNKLNKGKKLTDTEIGRLFAETTRMLEGTEQTAGQTETAQEQTKGVVLPMAEETGGTVLPTAEQAETQTQQRATEQERQTAPLRETMEAEQPGVLPTVEQAETRQRAARAETETERTGILVGVDEDTIAKVQRIANIVGREVVFFDEGADSTGGMHNGYYNPADGKIYVNARSQNPVAQIISHELTHSIEASGSYSDLQKLVLNRIRQTGGDLKAMRQQKAELYARHGENLTDNAAIDSEIVAEYVEKYLLTDEQSIRAMVQQNRTLGRRILQFINELLAKLGNRDAQERAFLTKAKNYYQSALQETQSSFTADMQQRAAAQAQNMDTLQQQMANGEISEEDAEAAFNDMYDTEIDMQQGLGRLQHSYAGANANGANLESLREAKEMQQAGADMESIRKATGWHEGMDGKWRFEIDDSGMAYHRGGDAAFSRSHADYAEYQKLMRKWMTGDVTEEEETRLQQLDETWGREYGRLSERVDRGNATLEDILDHDELFRNYPQLRRTGIRFADLDPGVRGEYRPGRNEIALDNSLRGAPEDTLIHEIQHAIQKAEGFARGSSPEYWNQPRVAAIKPENRAEIEAAQEEVERWEQRFVDEWGEGSVNLTLAQRYVELSEQLSEPGDSTAILQELENIDEMVEESGWDDLLTGYAGARAELSLKKAAALRNRFDSYTAYRNTAGEIEARDVAERRTMTAEERRERMPDTGDENTVFAEEAEDGYFSMSADEQAGIREQLRENQGRLNAMEVVGSVNSQEYAGLDTRRAREKLVAEIKKTGYKVDRQGFGEIRFEESEINNSLNYKEKDPSAEDARRTGFLVLQNVLKRGIEIDGHEMHKGRNYDTVTIAAPVEINGKRGNMAVVVKRTKGNRYKVHRILTPEGKTFTLPEMANAELNTVGAVTNNSQSLGGSAPAISSASETSITENGLPVKQQFSISEPVERTKDLIAMHNKDWSVIRDAALNWGGIPSPSVAIVDAAGGHTKYGDTSVVFPRATIDQEADPRNKVYGGDAWTPTKDNALVEREVNYEAKAQRVVPFSEAAAIIAPTSAPAEEIAAVKAATGVNIIQYETGNEEQRKALVNGLEGVKFSISEDSDGRQLTEEQQEFFKDSKAVDGRGRLLTLYHQTEGLFTVFDPRHQGAGSRDNATPFGIFLKTSDRDIGLKGKFQMELYANITNPLYASNREALTYSLLKLSDEYATIKAEIDTLDATYHEKFEQAKQELRDFMTEWRNKNPGASRRALYDVPEFNALYEAEDTVVEEWTQKADKLSTQAKNAITAALRNAGYDGVILSTDAGSFGRSTDAYIALGPEQVKNASNKKPTSDPDIRFSISEDGEYDGAVKLKESTIDTYLRDYAAKSSPKYAKAYITYMTPDDFLSLTTSEGGRQIVEQHSKELDAEKLGEATRWQPIQLNIDHETGEVLGHEGRHRAVAMRNAGVEQIPVLLFDSSNKYSKSEIGELTLTGQDFGGTWSDAQVQVHDLLPLSYENRDAVVERFTMPTDERTLQYSVTEEEMAEATLPTAEDEEKKDGIRTSLPKKAQDYLKRAENALVGRVSHALSVPRFAQREYLQEIAKQISEEYLTTGRVSEETAAELFERAYSEGIVVDEEFYQQYKDIKDHLRTQAVTISEEDKHDIADFNDFRKSAFGRLRIVNEGGLPVDVAYQELQDMAPELFPDSLTHPADKLVRMFEVAQSIEKTEKSLSEYYGRDAEEFKRWAKNDFDAAIGDTVGDLRTVKRYADERAEKENAAAEKPMTTEQVTEAYKQLKKARWESEKAKAKNLLTDHDNVQLGRLLKGEIELEHLDPKTDNVKGITAVYEATTEYERLVKLLTEYKQSQRAKLREEADKFLETANDWKDKKAGRLYSRETMERNILDIVKDKKLAQEIIAEYFTPVHEAQAKSTRLKNKMRERVRALNLSTKETKAMQKEGKISEAHAVQLLGEAMDNIRMLENSRGRMAERDGKTLSDWRSIVQNMWAQNPQLDKAKIEHAVEEFRSIYDELFQQMNEARVRNGYEPVNYRSGYFPHFQPGDGDGIMGLFGRALGIDTQVTALPTTINGLTHTFRPGIQWFGNAQQRLGFDTAYDAVEGFDRYIEGVADVIYQTDNIQKLRALATQARYRTGDEGIRKQVDTVYADTRLTEEEKRSKIDSIYEDGRFALSNFVVELEEYTNLLANKKSRADRNMEQALGRNMYNLVKGLESRVAANMVAINPASWLTNFIPLTQGGAMLDRGELLRGMWQTLQSFKENDGIVDASAFLTNRKGSDPLVRTWAQKASATMSSPMEYIDQFTAGSLVRARYNQNLKRGMSETAAMTEADNWTAGVMADRSKGSTPTLFNRSNPLTKVFTQFQLEVNNQLSYLFKDMPRAYKEKGLAALAMALFKFFLGAWLYNEVYEYFIGRRPALDPLGILNDTVGNITGWELPNLVELGVGAVTGDMPSFKTEKKNAYDTATEALGDVAEELPFIGGVLGGGRVPISSALPDWDNLLKTVTSDTWSTKKKLATAGKELMNPLTYLALPFGGGQLKKIYQGLSATIKGGSYSVDAEGNELLQYPVYNDDPWQAALNAGQAMLFGKTSLPTGRDWIESGFKTFDAKETAAYQAMTDAGVPDEDAYDLLLTLRGAKKTETESEAEQERRLLQEADISGDGKSVVYYGLMASDKERELMDTLADSDADMGAVTQVLLDVKNAGSLKGAEASNAKRTALAESPLTDDEKREVYRYLFGEKQEDGSYTTSRDDDIMAFEQAGMDFDTFLKVQNEYTTVNEKYSGASEKAVEFSRWVNSQNLAAEQAETVRDCFKYYSQIPAEAARYDSFVSAGLSDDAAYELANSLNALEPEDGKDSVSGLQRYRAVVDAGLSTEEQMSVLGEMMQESEYSKLQTGYSYGVTPEAYVSFRELLPKFDFDGNGTFKQEEVEAAIDSMGGGGNGIVLPGAGGGQNLTVTQQAALWQLANKSWKPAKNPYSTSVGQKVYDALNAETESGIVLPDGASYTGGLVLPKA